MCIYTYIPVDIAHEALQQAKMRNIREKKKDQRLVMTAQVQHRFLFFLALDEGSIKATPALLRLCQGSIKALAHVRLFLSVCPKRITAHANPQNISGHPISPASPQCANRQS
jgi:hypothetical protein